MMAIRGTGQFLRCIGIGFMQPQHVTIGRAHSSEFALGRIEHRPIHIRTHHHHAAQGEIQVRYHKVQERRVPVQTGEVYCTRMTVC